MDRKVGGKGHWMVDVVVVMVVLVRCVDDHARVAGRLRRNVAQN